MSPRTVNVVIGFTSPDIYPEPMVSQYNISTYGYKSPDDPHYFAPPRLKNNVTFEKSIGTVFWGNRSGVDFGNIDIAIEDGGIDSIAGEEVRWVEWAKENLNPQVTISVELGDGTLLHLATADTTDIFFPDSETIRVKLQAKHSRALQEYINDYFDTSYDGDVQGLPVPIYLGSGAIGGGGYDPSTFAPNTHVPAVLVDEANLRYVAAQSDLVDGSPSAYFVLDAGTVLREGESPGFTLWENGFELTSNPEDPITFVWVADQGGGVEDPYETGALLQGPFRICRWAVGQAGIDLDEFFPGETSFPDLIPSGFGLDEEQVPLLYYGSEVTAEKILDDCVLNLCGYWYVDELGFFDFGFFDAPEGITPSFAYTDVEMIGDIASTADRAPGLSALMEFSYSPGAFDIGNMAGSVSNVRRRRLSQEWRQAVTTEAIPEVYSRARGNEPMKFYNGGQNRPEVLDELNRRWSEYYSGVRRFYDWSIPLRGNEVLPELGDVGTIRSERAELLAYGDLPLVLTRIKYDLGKGLIHLRGWGGETASPPTPFDPSVYPDLVSWLDAREISTMTNSAGTPVVTSNLDQFRSWREWLIYPVGSPQNWSCSEWEWREEVGCYPAVTLNGDNTGAYNNLGSTRPVTQEEQTIFVVYTFTEPDDFAWVTTTMSSLSGTGAGGYAVLADNRLSGSGIGTLGGAIDDDNDQAYITTGATDPTGIVLKTIRGNGNGGVVEGWLNGNYEGSENLQADNYWRDQGFAIMGQFFGSSASPQGTLFFHYQLIYDRALTDEEVDEINAALLEIFDCPPPPETCELDGAIPQSDSFQASESVGSDPLIQRAYLQVDRDGNVYFQEATSTTGDPGDLVFEAQELAFTWLDGGDPDDYEVRLNNGGSSDTPGGDAEDAWLALTSDREWYAEGSWGGGGWEVGSFSGDLLIRKVSGPTGCEAEITMNFNTNDIS